MRIGILYEGEQTLAGRGFTVGQKVQVGGYFPAKSGKIVELNAVGLPFEAKVQLDGGNTYWIKSKFLKLAGVVFHQIVWDMPKSTTEVLRVGDIVNVGASYSKRIGTIQSLDPDIPGKAQVSLGRNGRSTCWIKLSNLSKRADVNNNPLDILCMKLAIWSKSDFINYFISNSERKQLICEAMIHGIKEGLLSVQNIQSIARIISSYQTHFQKYEANSPSYIERNNSLEPLLNINFENLPENCKKRFFSPETRWLAKCYNNQAYADFDFILNGETIHAHRFFLSLDERLSTYIYQGKSVIINDESEVAEIKSKLQSLYCSPLLMSGLVKSLSYYTAIYFNYLVRSEITDLIKFTDFTFKCGESEIRIHKVVLAQFSYFNSLFMYGVQEAKKENKALATSSDEKAAERLKANEAYLKDPFSEVTPAQFEEIKLIVEYLYTGSVPHQIAKDNWDNLLSYYNP